KTPATDVGETHFDTNLLLEVDQIVKTHPSELLSVKIVKGELQATSKHGTTSTYRVLNRSKDEKRDITIEHLTPAERHLSGDSKPVEGSQNLYRFPLSIEPKKATMHAVTEERTQTVLEKVAAMNEDTIQMYLAHATVTAKVKEALKKLSEQKAELTETQRQIEEINKQLKEISDEQARLRQNLEKVPSSSEAYKRYVKKFDDQETQIEKLQEQLKQKQSAAKSQQKTLEDSFKGLTAE